MNESGLEQQDAQIAATGYKKFARDIGLAGITNLLVNFSGLITLPIVSKNLGAYGYGIWGQLTIILILAGPLTTLGIPSAITRFLAGEKKRLRIRENFTSASLFILGTSLLVSLFLVLISKILGNAIFDGNSHLPRLLSIAIPFQGLLSIFMSYFRTFRRIKLWSLFTLLDVYGQVVLVAYFIVSGYGLDGMVYALIILKGAICIASGLFIFTTLGISKPGFQEIPAQLKFGIPLIPRSLSEWIVNVSDRWIIGLFLGATSVGYYIAPYALGEFIRMFFFPLGVILMPALSQLFRDNNEVEIVTHLRYSLKYFLMLAIPSAVGISLFSEPLLAILSTSEIAKNGTIITPIISVGIILNSVALIYQQPLLLAKKTHIVAGVWVLAAVINLGLNFVAVPLIGIVGAAITTSLAFAIVLAITIYYSSRIIKVPIEITFILKSIMASIVMGLVIWWIHPSRIWNIFLMTFAGASIYFVILLTFKGIKKNELKFFINLIRGR